MDPRGLLSISIVCLAVVVAVASEPAAGQSEAAGSGGQETMVGDDPALSTWPTNATSSSGEQVVGRGHLPVSQGERERVEPIGSDNRQREGAGVQKDGDYEGEQEGEDEYEDELKAVAEYEDELKAVAESHEAMSRDDTKNSNASTAGSSVADGVATAAKNFDSHEVITVNDSDEDIASNEAITDEVDDKYDREVAELLKYKKLRNANSNANGTKTKRVPTVKKELSTQREILVGSNETQVPKSLVPSEDTPNRLNEETEALRRQSIESTGTKELEDATVSERAGEGEVVGDNRYSESDPESSKKLDKRQETDLEYLDDLKAFLEGKLLKPGAEDDTRRENVRKLLAKFLDQVDHMERMQKFIVNVKNQLAKLSSREIEEPAEKGYESALFSTRSSDSRKSQKKFKRKRKKLRNRSTTTTLTPVPVTPPLLTTTETPWQTTPVQWRLVAERLFGPPWQQDLQGPEKPTGPRILPSMRDRIEKNKSKSGAKAFTSKRKPVADNVGDFGNQKLVRFGNFGGRQGHREFPNSYERSAESERMPEYDVAEAYRRLRYNQMSPPSREFLRRQEEDYQSDFGMQGDGFARGQDYETPGRDFALSKSWPDISYKYNPLWTPEERPLIPVPSEKWSWRRPQNEGKYRGQRNKFRPVDNSYWSSLSNEEEREEEAEAEKLWQQRAQYSWDRERSWPMEKSLKTPSWQGERPAKIYDREQSNGVWEKNNRSELNKLENKQESKEKVVLPQITMKTWNSLTSDPATWPHKLPGAKPWPKDENGKSYNPNADLVKKLGLDKQNNGGRSKEEAEKSNGEWKLKDEKQSRIFSSKESSKEEEVSQMKALEYKSNGDRSKPWAVLGESKTPEDWKQENMQGDDPAGWRRKGSWSNDTALPKIQAVGAWVMSADQSTWKPYPIRPIESSDDASRRWTRPAGKPSTDKWASKGFRSEKSNDPGMDQPNGNLWPEKPNVGELWPPKSNSWTSKIGNPDSWKTKEGDWSKTENSWSVKENGGPWNRNDSWPSKTTDGISKFNVEWPVKAKEEDTWKAGDTWNERKSNDQNSWEQKSNGWTSKIGIPDSSKTKEGDWSKTENSWSVKENGGPWVRNDSWPSKTTDDISKFNVEWPVKAKEEDTWKTGDTWNERKSNDQNSWGQKNDLSPWQQKMTEDWNYGKASSTGTWPSKWKQFAYHRVTAMPISKPGTTADAGAKSKNAFVAVSAVSSPKYTGSEWRKNEEEARNENGRSPDDQERSSNQLQVGLERPIYAWKKEPDPRVGSAKGNGTDPLENELEALRQIDFWFYKENEAEKTLTTTNANTETSAPANSTSATTQRRESIVLGNSGLLKTKWRTVSMK